MKIVPKNVMTFLWKVKFMYDKKLEVEIQEHSTEIVCNHISNDSKELK